MKPTTPPLRRSLRRRGLALLLVAVMATGAVAPVAAGGSATSAGPPATSAPLATAATSTTAAAGPIDRLERSIDTPATTPGTSTTVTVRLWVGEPVDSLRIEERFDPAFENESVEDVSIEGSDFVVPPGQANTTVDVDGDSIVVSMEDLPSGVRVAVAYRVTVPGDAAYGDRLTFAGTVTANGTTLTTTGDPAVAVTRLRATRDAPLDVGPSDLFTLRQNVTVEFDADALTIRERLDGPAWITNVTTRVDGAARVLEKTTNGSTARVELRDVDAGTSIAVRYAVLVSARANLGTGVEIVGDIDHGDARVSTGSETIRIGVYGTNYDFDGDGRIGTTEVVAAIQDWRDGNIATTFVLQVIDAWASRAEV